MTFMNAVRAQTVLLWKAKSVYFFLAVCTVQWVFLEVLFRTQDLEWRASTVHSEAAMLMCAMLGGMWGLLIWRDEPPKARHYHWTLPVDASVHDASRVVAGIFWLFVGIGLYVLLGMLALQYHDVPLYIGRVGLFPWLGVMFAALMAFGFVAALSTGTNRPIEYVLGSYALVAAGAIFAGLYEIEWLMHILAAIFSSDKVGSLSTTLFIPGEAAVDLYREITPNGPTIVGWLPTALMWLGVATLALSLGLISNRGRAR